MRTCAPRRACPAAAMSAAGARRMGESAAAGRLAVVRAALAAAVEPSAPRRTVATTEMAPPHGRGDGAHGPGKHARPPSASSPWTFCPRRRGLVARTTLRLRPPLRRLWLGSWPRHRTTRSWRERRSCACGSHVPPPLPFESAPFGTYLPARARTPTASPQRRSSPRGRPAPPRQVPEGGALTVPRRLAICSPSRQSA